MGIHAPVYRQKRDPYGNRGRLEHVFGESKKTFVSAPRFTSERIEVEGLTVETVALTRILY
jgi:hypothetical protein